MATPIMRRYTRAVPAALNIDAFATDDDTAQGVQQMNQGNAILDMFSAPQPAAGVNYEIRLVKNNIQTGRTFYSVAMDPASAGRSAVGPIDITNGQYGYQVRQVLGALTAYSFVVKYNNGF
jgi:hypothetical protein